MELEEENTVLLEMVLSAINKIETFLTLPDQLLQLSMITMSEYNRKYNPEIYNQYLVYALPIVEQMNEQFKGDEINCQEQMKA